MSTVSHHDPEAPAIYDAKKREFDRLWLAGQIGDATYLRSLFIGGKFTPADANTELSLLKMQKTERRSGANGVVGGSRDA